MKKLLLVELFIVAVRGSRIVRDLATYCSSYSGRRPLLVGPKDCVSGLWGYGLIGLLVL